MAKTAFFYNDQTGEIISKITVSQNSDLVLNKKMGLIRKEVSNTHRALGKLHEYEILQGRIKRKSQERIDKEESDKQEIEIQKRIPAYLKSDEEVKDEIILEYINQLKGQGSNITTNDLKAEVEKRKQEIYRNPAKKL